MAALLLVLLAIIAFAINNCFDTSTAFSKTEIEPIKNIY